MEQAQQAVSQADPLCGYYTAVRDQSLMLCRPLQHADYELQAAEFTSPAKWHLAHTSWFFETFLLKPNLAGYREFHPQFGHLFNSYYNGIGQPYRRNQRGLLSRPTLEEVLEYRHHIDQHMQQLLGREELRPLIELGLNHEQQHQELLLTDLQYCWSFNPLYPVYSPPAAGSGGDYQANQWLDFDGGIYKFGHKQNHGFAFDNEGPLHEALVQDFALAKRLTTNREYLEFMSDGGYQNPEFWLSDGWAWVQQQQISTPLYWQPLADSDDAGGYASFSLNGFVPLSLDAPVTHVSFYEADAYARWAGARLASEFEWEVSARQSDCGIGNFVDSRHFRPQAVCELTPTHGNGLQQQFGDCWEWTASPYQPYPGYQPAAGAVGEYNGKFMCNQMVLRGGSCVTPAGHIRPTYRNFFYPHERWQFTGIRLAR